MEEIDEDSLEWARKFKKKLRFQIGAVVYLKSDESKKCPMTVTGFELFEQEYDYFCSWVKANKGIESSSFLDKTLMQ
ncbi:MAG: hypothetical protein M1445_11630 [Bacteroidetes bacterium]|nr:hypothetical protein [Bacteroidota bacterium]MCL6101602.1 hypothetical protein [Bacteroidota bacterium]